MVAIKHEALQGREGVEQRFPGGIPSHVQLASDVQPCQHRLSVTEQDCDLQQPSVEPMIPDSVTS